MRSTTLALLALGLTSTFPIAPASAANITIRTTGIAAGTDGINLFGMGNVVPFQDFEAVYRFNEAAGTRQSRSIYNGFSPTPLPPAALFEVETNDKYTDGDFATPHMTVDFTMNGRTVRFDANTGSSAEVIDYLRRFEPSDRVYNLAARGQDPGRSGFLYDLSQFFLQVGRFPALGDAITGPLPPTSVTAPYAALGSQGLTNNHGNFNIQECRPALSPCLETRLKIYFSTSISVTSGVPEAPTWGMLIMGFGVTGYALRRRPKGTKRAMPA